MLAQQQRLSRHEVALVRMQGKQVHGIDYSLTYRKNTRRKFTVVVSKKTARRAVDRNRIRRQTYAILERCSPHIDTFHVVVFVRHSVKQHTFSELYNELAALCGKLR